MGGVLDSVRDASSPQPLERGGEGNSTCREPEGSGIDCSLQPAGGAPQRLPALVTALENRFGTAHQAELHRMKMRSRIRRREETLPELMEDIERLVMLAYPDAAPEMLELLAKDQFIDSLSDEDTVTGRCMQG